MFNSKFSPKAVIFKSLFLVFLAASFLVNTEAQVKRKPAARKTPVSTVTPKAVQPKPIPTPAVPVLPANLPKVTQIDEIKLKDLLKREGENAKPLLVNFWATWCSPCVEEFPDLVKISNDYKEKIDTITVSFDDLAEINRDVPVFLGKMNAEMPAYLLKAGDEQVAVKLVSEMWSGGLPFTILFDSTGKTIYTRQGKFKTPDLRAQIDKVLASK